MVDVENGDWTNLGVLLILVGQSLGETFVVVDDDQVGGTGGAEVLVKNLNTYRAKNRITAVCSSLMVESGLTTQY